MVLRDFKPWHVYLGIGMVLIPLFYAFSSGGDGQYAIFVVINGAAPLAVLYGIRLHRPELRLPWYLFASAFVCSVVGNVLALVQPDAPEPSWSDGAFLTAYPLAAASLLLLMLSASGRHKLAALSDAGIVTFAFAVFQWTFVMGPAIRAAGGTGEQVVDALYPAMDILLLAGLAGFFVSPAWRTPSFRLVGAGIGALFAGDEAVGLAPNSYSVGSWIDSLFLLAYVLLAVAALHPSMADLSQSRSMPTLRVSLGRIAVLAAALLVAPATLLEQKLRGKPLDLYEVLPLAAAISLLVVGRFSGILRALERIRLRERRARAAAEEMQTQLTEQNARLRGGGPAQGRVRRAHLARPAHAVDVDHRLRRACPRRGRRAGAGRRAPLLSRGRLPQLGTTAAARRRPALRRPPAGGAARARPDGARSRRHRQAGRQRGAASRRAQGPHAHVRRRRPAAGHAATGAGSSSCSTTSSRTRSSSRPRAATSSCGRAGRRTAPSSR